MKKPIVALAATVMLSGCASIIEKNNRFARFWPYGELAYSRNSVARHWLWRKNLRLGALIFSAC